MSADLLNSRQDLIFKRNTKLPNAIANLDFRGLAWDQDEVLGWGVKPSELTIRALAPWNEFN